MRNLSIFLLIVGIFFTAIRYPYAQSNENNLSNADPLEKYRHDDSPVDNNGFWKELIKAGISETNQSIPFKPAENVDPRTGGPMDQITSDICIWDETNVTQSENSIFIMPTDNETILNSNNSESGGGIYGANYLNSTNAGQSWTGSKFGAGGSNWGDPAACISSSGRRYIGYITSSAGQGAAYSDNGTTWTSVTISTVPTTASLLDKNHLMVDTRASGTYSGYVYSAWSRFQTGHTNDTDIEFSRSTNNGVSWSSPINISNAIAAASHNQGVNIQTGPTGQVYCVWVVYDNWSVTNGYGETAIGFARSLNGGSSFYAPVRIHNNILGIRPRPSTATTNPTGKNMRCNSFPSMAVDKTTGYIYVVWSNVGVPGTNTGTNVSVYCMRSNNGGVNWETPVRVNQGTTASDYAAFFPWITCDPSNGRLYCVYYDDRNLGSTSSALETWCSASDDGGLTWTAFRVGDVSFTPAPIPGLAFGYFGDYLGIDARDNWVYPTWTDNRSGRALTYVSPIQFDDYCIATSHYNAEHIVNVSIGSINNASGYNGFENFTNLSTNLPINGSELLTIENSTASYPSDQCGVWVDWNRDGDFTDANENIVVSGTPGPGDYTATIEPPIGTTLGACTMRIRLTYTGAVDPCGVTSYGEVEDYTINVTSAVTNVWDGSFNHYWHNANNWSLNRIPIAIDPVEIPNVGLQPVWVDIYDEECASVLVGSGATLNIYDQTLTINGDMNISGELGMVDATSANSIINVMGNVAFNSGSTWNVTATNSFINVYQDWNFNAGANANATIGFVDFRGTTNEFIRCFSSNCSFNNLRNYKSGGAYLGISAASTEDLVVNNLIYTTSTSILNSYDDNDVVVKGFFNYYGAVDLTLGGGAGALIFDGVNGYMNNYSSGTAIVSNLIASASNITEIVNGNLEVNGNVTVEDGTFNMGSNTITVHGNWTNTGGITDPGTSTVIFESSGNPQDVNGTCTFYDVQQIDVGEYLRFYGPTTIQNNLELQHFCWAYNTFQVDGQLNIDDPTSKFTANGVSANATIAVLNQGGTIYCNAAATITINDLVESYILGTYYSDDPGCVVNLSNAGSTIDLGGDLIINGGTMNISGSICWWPYSQNASITMTDGVLDVIGCDIYIYNTATYSLTDNITGGTIRTDHGFSGNRADFTPSAGTFEFYGGITEYLTQANGCTLPNVVIDKLAPSKSSSFPTIQKVEDGRIDKYISDSKSPDIFLSSNFVVTNYLNVNSGSLTLNGYELTTGSTVDVYGTLTMNNAADILNPGGWLTFWGGSTGNLSNGNIYSTSWVIPRAGCSFTASANNTITFIGFSGGGASNFEPTATYGNIIINKNPGNTAYVDGSATEPVILNGNCTVNPDNNFQIQGNTFVVHGVLTDNSSSSISTVYAKKDEGKGEPANNSTGSTSNGAKGGVMEIDNAFTLNGLLDVGDGDVLMHGAFSTAATSTLIIDGGSVIDDSPGGTDNYHFYNGSLNITDGLLEVSNNSIYIGSTASTNISGGTLRTGAFNASTAGTFLPTGGTVEIIGAATDNVMYCSNGNFFYDLLINRQAGFASYPFTEIIIQNDLTIQSGVFSLIYGSNIYVGGDWVNNVGTGGFIPSTGLVTFNGTNDVLLSAVGGQNFNNLTIDKASSADFVNLSGNANIAGNMVVDGGSLYSNANDIMVTGNVNVNTGAVLYMEANSTLGVGDGMSLNVNNGGWLYAVGSPGNQATITHTSTGYYGFNIVNGATIGAQNAIFEYMNGNGVYVQTGGLVHGVFSFNNCIFRNGHAAPSALLALNGSNVFTSTGAYFENTLGATGYNVWKATNSGNVEFIDATGDFQGEDHDYDPYNRVNWTYTTRTLNLTAFLEGPYNPATNKLETDLNGILPLIQPYNPPLPYYGNPLPDWYYTGTESVGFIPNTFVVDWVLLQLRDATSAATASSANAFATIPAFILNTGEIVDLDGLNPVTFLGSVVNDLFVVVWHRNHLGIISANALVEAGGTYTYNFSSGESQVYGGSSGHKELEPGVWGMIAADGDGNGLIQIGDKNGAWLSDLGLSGYLGGDFDMNSVGQISDKNVQWLNNLGTGGQIPAKGENTNTGYASQVPK